MKNEVDYPQVAYSAFNNKTYSRSGVPNLSLTIYPFSILRGEHVALQHVDRWKCTPKISCDKIYYHVHS